MKKGPHYLQDSKLPHLARALDGNSIRRICRGLIRHREGAAIGTCRVTRLRYKRSLRATIQYQITVLHRDGSEETLWLAGYQYADRNRYESGVRRLERLLANQGDDGEMPPGLAIDSLGLLLMRFPYDRRLPALMSLYFNIEQLLDERLPKMFGNKNWKLESLDTRLIRWRVGVSAVARLSVEARHATSGRIQRKELYLKADPKQSENEVNSRLAALARQRKLPFALCRTVLSLPRQGIRIQTSAQGSSLEEKLIQGKATTENARELGCVLAYWHTNGDPLQESYSKENFESGLERSVRVLTAGIPESYARLDKVAKNIRFQMLHRLQRPTHLDLKAEHIFFDASRVTLIDTDSAADADPMLDIAVLYARLRHGKELSGLPKGSSRNFAGHLIRAYAARVPPSWWYNFRACYAWALLSIAMAPFTRQRPGWPQLVDRLLREAELALQPSSELLSFLPNRELSGQGARRVNYSTNLFTRVDRLR